MSIYFQGSELEALWPNPAQTGSTEVTPGDLTWARRGSKAPSAGWNMADAGTSLAVAWYHFRVTAYSSNTVLANNTPAWITTGDDTEVILRLRTIANGICQLQYWNGTSFIGVGDGFNWDSGLNSTLDIRIEYGASQDILELYRDEILVAGKTTGGKFLSFTGSQKLFIRDAPNVVFYYQQVNIAGTPTIDWNSLTVPPSTLGSDADGVGNVTDVNEAVIDNNTFISFTAAGQRGSFKAAARSLSNEVLGVTVATRLRRKDDTSPTQAKLYLKLAGVRYYSGMITLTLGYRNYQYTWNVNPATSAAWTPSEANDANLEWGVEIF